MTVAQIFAGGGGYVLPIRSAYDTEMLLHALQYFLRDRERLRVRLGFTPAEVRRAAAGTRCSACFASAHGVVWGDGPVQLCTRCACARLPGVHRKLAKAA
ncbi:MAG: hypothetical protein KatS3mg077_2256 [Candidatus Binatia bacterium]|nr:MAG: hypothetical protein KatS3mg077_2256 [Candidatus Binatia bacterium]